MMFYNVKVSWEWHLSMQVQSQGCAKHQPFPRRLQSLLAAVRVQNPQCKLVALCTLVLCIALLCRRHSLISLLLSLSSPATGPGLPLYSEVVRGSEEPPEAPGSPASSCPLCRRRNWNQVGCSMFFTLEIHSSMFPGGRGYVATRTLAGAFLCNFEPTAASRGPHQHRAPRGSYPGPPGIPSAGNGVQS